MILAIVLYFWFLECMVIGHPGDGSARGTCPEGQICQSDGTCFLSNLFK